MATPSPVKPPRTELDYGLSFKKTDAVVVVLRELIKWGGVVLLARYGYLSIAALAGHQTFADIFIRLLANLKVSDGILYLLTGGSIAYGVGQRHLRRKHIKRIVATKNKLESKLDPKRTSSNLTETGTTRPGDEL
jgi:hypothetical protein